METIIDLDALELDEGREIDASQFAALLTSYQENTRLEVILFSFYCKDRLTLVQYMSLARFFGCYNYIVPAERDTLPELSDYLYSKDRYNLFSLALKVDAARVHLNLEKQRLLLSYLQTKDLS